MPLRKWFAAVLILEGFHIDEAGRRRVQHLGTVQFLHEFVCNVL